MKALVGSYFYDYFYSDSRIRLEICYYENVRIFQSQFNSRLTKEAHKMAIKTFGDFSSHIIAFNNAVVIKKYG